MGGSLGAKSINEAVFNNLEKLTGENIQIIWQCGEFYFDKYKNCERSNVKILPFIKNMQAAYSAADLVIARAGATTIAEVSAMGLPVIFVPSPNVAEDHQYKNAEALVGNNAAVLIKDSDLKDQFSQVVLSLINNDSRLSTLKNNIKKFSKPDAARVIAENAIKLVESI